MNYNFIIHLPSSLNINKFKLKETIKKINLFLPNKSEVLFENSGVSDIEFMKILMGGEDPLDFQICLDLGHILKRFKLELFEEFCNEILSVRDFNSRISEVHIHNVIEGKDHNMFTDDECTKTLKNILNKLINCKRCILETKMNEFDILGVVGIKQIKLFEFKDT